MSLSELGSVREEMVARFRVFPAPNYVINEVMMGVYENPEHEKEHGATEQFLVVLNVGVQRSRYKKEPEEPEEKPNYYKTTKSFPGRVAESLAEKPGAAITREFAVVLESPNYRQILE